MIMEVGWWYDDFISRPIYNAYHAYQQLWWIRLSYKQNNATTKNSILYVLSTGLFELND